MHLGQVALDELCTLGDDPVEAGAAELAAQEGGTAEPRLAKIYAVGPTIDQSRLRKRHVVCFGAGESGRGETRSGTIGILEIDFAQVALRYSTAGQ